MSASTSRIIHQTISKTSRQIRLLRVLSEVSAEDIECSLDVFNIDSAPPYTAISYTWGKITPARDMVINKAKTSVRENCHKALRLARLHRKALSDYVWIDAICIDQENLLEKNHQVNLMAEIYLQAEFVLVSLGSEYPSIQPDFIEKTLLSQHWIEHEIECEHLLQVSKASYWSRLWIVQEYLVARQGCLYIAVGGKLVDSRSLTNLLNAINRKQKMATVRLNRELFGLRRYWKEIIGSNMASLSLQREEKIQLPTSNFGVGSFNDLLQTYSHHACADTRDKVFGLLHLVQWPNPGETIHADYTKSTLAVAADCLRLGVSPLLARTALQLNSGDPHVQNWTQSLNDRTLQDGALNQIERLLDEFPELPPFPRCDRRCASRYSEVMNPRIYPVAVDGTPHQTHFPTTLRITWFPDHDTNSAHISYQDYEDQSRFDEMDSEELLLVRFVANVDFDIVEIATIWVPWTDYGIHALAPEFFRRDVYNLVCRNELGPRVTLAGIMLLAGEPYPRELDSLTSDTTAGVLEYGRPQVTLDHILNFCGLILHGTDQALYLIVGPATKKPRHAVQCNSWLDDPLFRNEQSRFYHVVQARDFYREKDPHRAGCEMPIYMDPEDVMVTICQEFERLWAQDGN